MKKDKKSFKQRMFDNVYKKLQPYVQDKIDSHDEWLVNLICDYIVYLACDVNSNYDLEQIIQKIKNKEYLQYDKEKHIESN